MLRSGWIGAVIVGTCGVAWAQEVQRSLPQPTSSTQPIAAPVAASEADVDFDTAARVSVHLKNAPVEAAAKAVADQAGVPTRLSISSYRGIKPPAPRDFDVTDQPFVQALMSLCDAYDLKEPGSRSDEGWSLFPRKGPARPGELPQRPSAAWGKSPCFVNGPIAVFATAVRRNRAIDFDDAGGARTAADHFEMSLIVVAEPRIVILERPFFPTFEEFVDDCGTNLAMPSAPDGVTPRLRAPNNEPWTMLCQMSVPDPKATKIAKLAGNVALNAVTRVRRLEIADSANGTPTAIDLGGLRASAGGFHSKPGSVDEQTITIFRDQVDPAEWTRRLRLLGEGSRIRAFNTDGTMLQPNSRTQNGEADSATVRLQYSRARGADRKPTGGPPVRVTWDVPIESGKIEVPFTLSDLPLPAK